MDRSTIPATEQTQEVIALRIEIHPQALDEAAAALAWYQERSSQAPAAFVQEVDEAIQFVLEAPGRWPIFEEGCRRFPLRRFPYSIIYRERPGGIVQILAVAHGRRRPGYWHHRSR